MVTIALCLKRDLECLQPALSGHLRVTVVRHELRFDLPCPVPTGVFKEGHEGSSEGTQNS